MLGLVEHGERLRVINAWTSAQVTGVAHTAVRIAGGADQNCDMHFIDMTHRYGVHIGLLINFAGGFVSPPAQTNLPPRRFTISKDSRAVNLEVDPAASLVVGWPLGELLEHRTLDYIHPDDQERAVANWMETLSRPETRPRVRFRHRHLDGHWVWLEVTNHNRLADPDHRDILTEMINISDEMAAHEAVQVSERLLRRLTETLPVGVLQIDADRRVVYANKRLLAMLGCADATTVDEQLESVLTEERAILLKAVRDALVTGADNEVDIAFRSPSRRIHRATVSINALTSEHEGTTGAILCLTDVTRDVHLRQELEDRATYDSLTKCRNRASILSSLEDIIATGKGTGIAVMFIDLDNFKEVNDRLGHGAGDQLLSRVGRRLLASARSGDLVGRVGGDEFLVVCQDVAVPAIAMSIARRAAGRIRTTTTISGERLTPRASIGVAWTTSTRNSSSVRPTRRCTTRSGRAPASPSCAP